MGVIGIHGFLSLLIVAVAAIVGRYQGGNDGPVMLEGIDFTGLGLVAVEAADIVLSMC